MAIRRSSRRGSPWIGDRAEVAAQFEAVGRELRVVGQHRLDGNRRQVDLLVPLEPGLPACQRKQRVDHLLEVLLGGEHALVRGAQRCRVSPRVGERHLDQGSLTCQRRPELV